VDSSVVILWIGIAPNPQAEAMRSVRPNLIFFIEKTPSFVIFAQPFLSQSGGYIYCSDLIAFCPEAGLHSKGVVSFW
jgi:hypothetical protein